MDNKKNKSEDNNGGNKITNYFSMKQIAPSKPKYVNVLTNKAATNINPARKKSEFHQSSKQAQEGSDNGTQILISSGDEKDRRGDNMVCKQLIMIGPCDVTYYPSNKKKLEAVLNQYSKQRFLQYLLDNVRYSNKKIENLNNLKKIHDDQFWSTTLPTLLGYATNDAYQKLISSRLLVLSDPEKGNSQKIQLLSKAQILMLMINMFLNTLPKQTYRPSVLTFSYLLTLRPEESQSSAEVRFQKLKCIVNYFNVMVKRSFSEMDNLFITVRRGSSYQKISQEELTQIDYNLYNVDFKLGLIEDEEGRGVMVDFANKVLGGGVLTNGAVQEEILFMCYPQLMCTMCICEELGQYEGVLVEGAERVNWYQGYSDTFRFVDKPNIDDDKSLNIDDKRTDKRQSNRESKRKNKVQVPSLFVAVDASNFSNHVMKSQSQFIPTFIDREIFKFLAAGELVNEHGVAEEVRIVTGRWGCGAFKGDPHLKFTIQWVASSIMRRDLLYMGQDRVQLKEMETMYGYLRKYTTRQLREVICDYHEWIKDKCGGGTFLAFMKDMA